MSQLTTDDKCITRSCTQYNFRGVNQNKAKQQGQVNSTSSAYPSTKRLLAKYGEGSLYAALPLHMQRGCFPDSNP